MNKETNPIRKAVLIYEDEPIILKDMSKHLERSGLSVFPTRHLIDAAEVLFSSHPPAVFIADMAVDLWINESIYDEIRNKYHFESGTHGNTGVLALIHDTQEQVRDVRIILNSGINTVETARSLGIFGYMKKPFGNENYNNLIEVCRLGTLRNDELNNLQRLKEGPLNLDSSDLIKPYIKRFWSNHGKERK